MTPMFSNVELQLTMEDVGKVNIATTVRVRREVIGVSIITVYNKIITREVMMSKSYKYKKVSKLKKSI